MIYTEGGKLLILPGEMYNFWPQGAFILKKIVNSIKLTPLSFSVSVSLSLLQVCPEFCLSQLFIWKHLTL